MLRRVVLLILAVAGLALAAWSYAQVERIERLQTVAADPGQALSSDQLAALGWKDADAHRPLPGVLAADLVGRRDSWVGMGAVSTLFALWLVARALLNVARARPDGTPPTGSAPL